MYISIIDAPIGIPDYRGLEHHSDCWRGEVMRRPTFTQVDHNVVSSNEHQHLQVLH